MSVYGSLPGVPGAGVQPSNGSGGGAHGAQIQDSSIGYNSPAGYREIAPRTRPQQGSAPVGGDYKIPSAGQQPGSNSLEGALAELQRRMQEAAMQEDYDSAAELKEQATALQQKIAAAAEVGSLATELVAVQARMRQCAVSEDFEGAARLKEEAARIEARMGSAAPNPYAEPPGNLTPTHENENVDQGYTPFCVTCRAVIAPGEGWKLDEERSWHRTCFVCGYCKQPFKGAFVRKENQVYHKECQLQVKAVQSKDPERRDHFFREAAKASGRRVQSARYVANPYGEMPATQGLTSSGNIRAPVQVISSEARAAPSAYAEVPVSGPGRGHVSGPGRGHGESPVLLRNDFAGRRSSGLAPPTADRKTTMTTDRTNSAKSPVSKSPDKSPQEAAALRAQRLAEYRQDQARKAAEAKQQQELAPAAAPIYHTTPEGTPIYQTVDLPSYGAVPGNAPRGLPVDLPSYGAVPGNAPRGLPSQTPYAEVPVSGAGRSGNAAFPQPSSHSPQRTSPNRPNFFAPRAPSNNDADNGATYAQMPVPPSRGAGVSPTLGSNVSAGGGYRPISGPAEATSLNASAGMGYKPISTGQADAYILSPSEFPGQNVSAGQGYQAISTGPPAYPSNAPAGAGYRQISQGSMPSPQAASNALSSSGSVYGSLPTPGQGQNAPSTNAAAAVYGSLPTPGEAQSVVSPGFSVQLSSSDSSGMMRGSCRECSCAAYGQVVNASNTCHHCHHAAVMHESLDDGLF